MAVFETGTAACTCMAVKPPLFAATRNAAMAERWETSEAARIARLDGAIRGTAVSKRSHVSFFRACPDAKNRAARASSTTLLWVP